MTFTDFPLPYAKVDLRSQNWDKKLFVDQVDRVVFQTHLINSVNLGDLLYQMNLGPHTSPAHFFWNSRTSPFAIKQMKCLN